MKIKNIAIMNSDAAVTTDHCGLHVPVRRRSVRYSVSKVKIAIASRIEASRFSPLYLESELRKRTVAVSRPAPAASGPARGRNHPLFPDSRSASHRNARVAAVAEAIARYGLPLSRYSEEMNTIRYPIDIVVNRDQFIPLPKTVSIASVIITPETSRSMVIS